MSEVLELTDERLAEALRCCAKSEAAACRKCPMGISTDGEKCCFDVLRLKAAERIGALAEENRRLRDATEGYAKELVGRMVTLAREGNTAGARMREERKTLLRLMAGAVLAGALLAAVLPLVVR